MLDLDKFLHTAASWSYAIGYNSADVIKNMQHKTSVEPGGYILDLACGYGLSSLALAQLYPDSQIIALERDVNLFSLMKWKKMYNINNIIPIQADARVLPFCHNFFSAVFCVNALSYFATDDKFFPYLAQYIKPDGTFYAFDLSFRNEIKSIDKIPEVVKEDYAQYWQHIHNQDWWRFHIDKNQLFENIRTKTHSKSEDFKIEYAKRKEDAFAEACGRDEEQHIQFFELYARRNKKKSFLESF